MSRTEILEVLIVNAIRLAGGRIKSEFRLNKTLYMADWYHALETGQKITELSWTRHHHGPFLHNLHAIAKNTSGVLAVTQKNGAIRWTSYTLRNDAVVPPLVRSHEEALARACKLVESSSHEVVRKIVYDTPPMRTAKLGDKLDIERRARAERLERAREFGRTTLPQYRKLLEKLS